MSKPYVPEVTARYTISVGRFEEDGSFIGQYGTIRKQPSFPLPPTTLPSSAIVVTARDPAITASIPGTFV